MIRPFANSDIPALTAVWFAHHQDIDPQRVRPIDPVQLEWAILSKPWFDHRSMLVATDDNDGRVVAWAHRVGNRLMALVANPAVPLPVLQRLMQHDSFADEIQTVGITSESHFGYAGLAPIGWGVGIDDRDQRVRTILEAAGFRSRQAWSELEATVSRFRMPINREFLSLRRTLRITTQSIVGADPTSAAADSHLDAMELIILGGADLPSVKIYESDREAAVMCPDRALLRLEGPAETSIAAQTLYGIGSWIGSASTSGLRTVSTSLPAESEAARSLESIGWSQVQSGWVFERCS